MQIQSNYYCSNYLVLRHEWSISERLHAPQKYHFAWPTQIKSLQKRGGKKRRLVSQYPVHLGPLNHSKVSIMTAKTFLIKKSDFLGLVRTCTSYVADWPVTAIFFFFG
jgi:hypothetical protein